MKIYQKRESSEVSTCADDQEPGNVDRRKFLKFAGSATVGAAAIGVGLFSIDSIAATKIGKAGNATLLRMARDIFPNDKLEDKYYQQVVVPLAEESSSDPDTLKLIQDGLVELDQLSVKLYGMAYLAVKKESDRVVILKTVESTGFFQKIKGALMMGIYNNPELWPRFGYGGSSWEKGGYIHRGYNDIDWL